MEEKKETESKPINSQNSRRNFLKVAGVAAGAAAIVGIEGTSLVKTVKAVTASSASPSTTTTPTTTAIVPAFYQSPGLTKFSQPLRGVYPLDFQGIPVAIPDGSHGVGGAIHYKIDIAQYTDTLHPNLGGVTTLRGYRPQNTLGGAVGQRHLGGIIIANKGQPTQITFSNKLSLTNPHPIPIDRTIMGADKGDNRACTHLHGGYVPWISDGGPFAWFAPGNYGDSMQLDDYKVLNPKIKDGEAEYYYPNDQSARMLWYHDHSFGITRMNAYVGIASAYIIRDSFEAGLVAKGLPQYIENGGRELPIVIQDKIFVGADIATADPTWTGSTTPGSLWYAHYYDPNRWDLTGQGVPPAATPADPSIIPEFFGDTMLANGVVYPEVNLEPRRYRLRILNACQARFLNLQLYVEDSKGDSITLKATPITPTPTAAPFNNYTPTNKKGPNFLVIGTEGGFLPNPVEIPSNQPFDMNTLGGSLITAPAERWDLIVDFKGFEGKSIILYNDAPAPFPMGDPINDYFPGNADNPTTTNSGFGPNSRQIMRFNIGKKITKPADAHLQISTSTDLKPGNDPLLVPLGQTTLPKYTPVRRLTLNEMNDGIGRLIQMLGTDQPPVSVQDGFGRGYMDRPTEVVNAGDTEVWQIINLTGDTHPIHFHLVNVQIISRQPFDAVNYNGGQPTLTGFARPPDKDEQGWKETVRVNPGEVANVIMKFKLPTVPFKVPQSRRTCGYGGNEYVWHCHILEHEEHDMMRPLIVKSNGNDNQQCDNNQQ